MFFCTRISQQLLPTAVTPTPQSVLKAWRAAVICTERGTDTECCCVCCEDRAEGNIETLQRVAVNCGPQNPIKNDQMKFALYIYTHTLYYCLFSGLSNDHAFELGFSCQVISCLTPTESFCVLLLRFNCLLQNIRHCTLNFQDLSHCFISYRCIFFVHDTRCYIFASYCSVSWLTNY